MMEKKLGHILSGSLVEGLVMRLDQDCSLEAMKTGKFVCVKGKSHSFFSLITDLELHVSHPDILQFPPAEDEKLLASVTRKYGMYAKVVLRPMLMFDFKRNRMPVKTIPEHFSPVFQATKEDIAEIFGDEKKDKKFFHVGEPLDMTSPVCLDLDRFVERSSGVFGKTGTGKTFITRVLLAGLIKNERAVSLIFDVHNEYGVQARQEGNDAVLVKGLKSLFPSKVAIFSIDPEATRRRGSSPDVEVRLSYEDIRVEDVLSLQDELSLHPTALEAAYLISSKYKRRWLRTLLEQESTIKEFAEQVGAHAESVAALYRKLKRLERFPFLQEAEDSSHVVDRMMEYLKRGVHIVLEFGNQTSMLAYLLVSNILSRRIHEAYVAQTELFLSTQNKTDQPRQLMIVIEEAHKFLNPVAAKQTIFGVIAREMRKYYVSLLVVDQRPSGIDPEIISQVGTKIIAQLNDEKDIQAVLMGMSNATGLRAVLATLDSKKQALLLGHAVPMPIVIKTREYDQAFYASLGQDTMSAARAKSIIDEIFV